MEALKEIGGIALVLLVAIILGNVAVHIYWRIRLRNYDKAERDYEKGVQEAKTKEFLADIKALKVLQDKRNSKEIKKSYSPTGRDADRAEAVFGE